MHTFDCQMCDFAGLAQAIMQNHILHIAPDDNNLFACDIIYLATFTLTTRS